ncbi:uncharacterized protein N7483_009592 [Penicillium malachiteum]|uniref:uncharacterized protein n=1 Tax=Penicillium malachiteum TaxID=1324776 RepID=UPI0025498586|nr:uncharacterized protein N7483_009592 [Penicillium malachiteum]KAJ5721658.1 hypothetical protein N7483_009592 [Penicillium malachiteum]
MDHLREACSSKGEKVTELAALLCSPWTTEESSSPLIVASYLGLGGVVDLFLDYEETDVNSRDAQQQTALSRAAENGHEAVVKLLLETEQVDINSKDSLHQRTPLSRAADNGHEAVAKLLSEASTVYQGEDG